MTKELKRFEQWWDAEDDIPNNGPYTPDTPIQFAWAAWQAALASEAIEQPAPQKPIIKSYLKKDNSQPVKWSDYEPDGMHHNKPQKRPQNCGTGYCSCIECVMEPAQQEPVAWEQFYPEMGKPKLAYLPPTESPENACYIPPAQQEPVAWMFQHEETGRMMCVDAQQVELGFEKFNPRLKKIAPLYTSPPAQRPWVGLTDEEIINMSRCDLEYAALIGEVQRKLKEKNNG